MTICRRWRHTGARPSGMCRRRWARMRRPVGKRRAWGWAADREIDYPVQHRLGLHIIEQLMEAQFDVAHTRRLPDGAGMAHAFGFVYQRIMAPQGDAAQTPTVPLMINTYYPPNQVTPQRCYEFGRAVRQAVESWKDDLRVGVIASGGLSHFVVDGGAGSDGD